MPNALTIALVGNPNAGKTTLFNALTGLHQRVGNYPGVTVELKRGDYRSGERLIQVIDLPGTYSLAPRSPDEMVAVDLLLGRRPEEPPPDLVVCVVDASNLERHLYLASQVLELGRPVILALNMVDVAERQGIRIDTQKLSERLGVPVVPIQANVGIGLDDLRRAIEQTAHTPKTVPTFPDAFVQEVGQLAAKVAQLPSFLVARAILDVGGYSEEVLSKQAGPPLATELGVIRERLAAANCRVPAIEARVRYGWIRSLLADCLTRPVQRPVSWTDRLDAVLTHRLWGTVIFLTVMFGLFQLIFVGAKPLMKGISAGKDWLADLTRWALPPGPFTSLLADGVLEGIGSVLMFLPQILILFGFIAILEDCGYMARAAFLMDRLMSRCGLSGKSFIPMLSSMACAVPGILATRVIENPRDRLATILVAPLMSCSARLPVYLLLTGAFLSNPWWLPGVVVFAMYGIGLVVAPLVAWTLKSTLLRGATPVFVMEMPEYRQPMFSSVLRRMYDAGAEFVKRAGTIILATMILVWAFLYFPAYDANQQSYDLRLEEMKEQIEGLEKRKGQLEEAEKAKLAEGEAAADEARATESEDTPEKLEQQIEELKAQSDKLSGEWKRQSYLGQMGLALEPIFVPLGWDWKIGMAVLASFPAREVVVATLGVIYNKGKVDTDEVREQPKGHPLGEAIDKDWEGKRAKIPAALSLMVFFALCCQCASTLATIRRETRSWFWTVFTFVYMTGLAYIAALVVYQVGRLF